jgi:hypothetical protein
MKRLVAALALAFGMLAMGITSASASTFCSIDPTIGVGLPIHYKLNISLLGTHVYVYGTSRTTTFGGVIGL